MPAAGSVSPARIRSRVDLPAPFGADEADDVAGRDHQVEPGEERAVAVARRDAAGEQGRGHDLTLRGD